MDMSKYTGVFRIESEKYIKELSDSLLTLEKDPENIEQMNMMFRTVHTFKGMAATMGFREIVEFAHEMENLINRLRIRELIISSSLIDILFRCLDILEELVEEVCSNGRNESEEKKTDDMSKTDNISRFYADFYEVLKNLKAINTSSTDIYFLENKNLEIKVGVKDIGNMFENKEKSSNPLDYSLNTNSTSFTDSLSAPGNSSNISLEHHNPSSDASSKILPNSCSGVTNTPSNTILNTFETSLEDSLKIPDVSLKSPRLRGIQSSRISIEKLDKLIDLASELTINMGRINEFVRNLNSKELEHTVSQSYKLTREIHEEIIDARMVPLDQITHLYPRMIRDLARSQNKEIDFIIKGKELKLDRSVLGEIGDSLVHLLRNAVDHGIELPEKRKKLGKIETGTITITASRQGDFAFIKIEDDGSGIDIKEIWKIGLEKGLISKERAAQPQEKEAMQLIFAPGFSTASKVTDISGRGVGMDVVKNRIERLGGSINIDSKPGFGSCFELKLPLTIALYQAILVKVGIEKYAIPFTNIVKNIEIQVNEIKNFNEEEVFVTKEKNLPLFRLQKLFQVPFKKDIWAREYIPVVIVEKAGQEIGLIVDKLIGKQEIIGKNFKSKLLENIKGFSGATILGDGSLVLILDVSSLPGTITDNIQNKNE